MAKDMNLHSQIIKLLEDNVGNTLHDTGVDKDFPGK